jgi:hypothetical protein
VEKSPVNLIAPVDLSIASILCSGFPTEIFPFSIIINPPIFPQKNIKRFNVFILILHFYPYEDGLFNYFFVRAREKEEIIKICLLYMFSFMYAGEENGVMSCQIPRRYFGTNRAVLNIFL